MVTDEVKQPLKNLLETVTDDNKNYYVLDDKWNGKKYNEKGYWNDFIFPYGIREKGNHILDNARNKDIINETYDEVKEGIENLIPTTQVNATKLYEYVTGYWGFHDGIGEFWGAGDKYKDKERPTKEDCTATTWGPYEENFKKAKTLLNSLFDNESIEDRKSVV